MRQYRISNLWNGKTVIHHAGSVRVALNRAFDGRDMDSYLKPSGRQNVKTMSIEVTDMGESILIARVSHAPTQWHYLTLTHKWFGRPETERKRILVAEGIPEGWTRVRRAGIRIGAEIYQDTCGICGAKTPEEPKHRRYHTLFDKAAVAVLA